eukprot:jgi/Botrbrau1/19603/Bobra.0035s0081.1
MGRWNSASPGTQRIIELLPSQPQLPVLLDGFIGPINQRESAEQQVYVLWSQVQCFLRMTEEALRAKNAAHYKLIGEMALTRSELEEKRTVFSKMLKEGDALTEDSTFLKQQMASLLEERQLLQEKIAALERENKFLWQERDLLKRQLDLEETARDEDGRQVMHPLTTLARMEELRQVRTISSVEQQAARLALAACLKDARHTVSNNSFDDRPDTPCAFSSGNPCSSTPAFNAWGHTDEELLSRPGSEGHCPSLHCTDREASGEVLRSSCGSGVHPATVISRLERNVEDDLVDAASEASDMSDSTVWADIPPDRDGRDPGSPNADRDFLPRSPSPQEVPSAALDSPGRGFPWCPQADSSEPCRTSSVGVLGIEEERPSRGSPKGCPVGNMAAGRRSESLKGAFSVEHPGPLGGQ